MVGERLQPRTGGGLAAYAPPDYLSRFDRRPGLIGQQARLTAVKGVQAGVGGDPVEPGGAATNARRTRPDRATPAGTPLGPGLQPRRTTRACGSNAPAARAGAVEPAGRRCRRRSLGDRTRRRRTHAEPRGFIGFPGYSHVRRGWRRVSHGGSDLGCEPFGGGEVITADEVCGHAVVEGQVGELLYPLLGRAVQYAGSSRGAARHDVEQPPYRGGGAACRGGRLVDAGVGLAQGVDAARQVLRAASRRRARRCVRASSALRANCDADVVRGARSTLGADHSVVLARVTDHTLSQSAQVTVGSDHLAGDDGLARYSRRPPMAATPSQKAPARPELEAATTEISRRSSSPKRPGRPVVATAG